MNVSGGGGGGASFLFQPEPPQWSCLVIQCVEGTMAATC